MGGAGLPLLVLIGVGLAAGAAEVAVLAARAALFGDMLRVSRQTVWMAPVGVLILLLPLFVLLRLAALGWPRAGELRTVLTAALFVALCGVLLSLNALHDVAVVVLGLGGAWRLGQYVSRDRPRLLRVARVGVPSLLVLVLLAGAAVNGTIVVRERAALAALPQASGGAANVIIIIWDTVRAASMSLHGGRARTPNLERLAARGVVFDRALATAPWTLPTHASLLTGRLPHELSVSWTRRLDDTHGTLAESLGAHGYRSGAFAANVLYVQWQSGLDRGFTRFEDYRVTPGQVFISTALGRRIMHGRHGWETGRVARLVGYRDFVGRKRAEHVNRATLDWIGRDASRPWFAFLNYFDAHLPFMPPAPFAGRMNVPRARPSALERIRQEWERNGYWDMPPHELAGELAAYEESIEYLDHALGELLDALERRGELDNTLVIVTSDHGEEFGEHGQFEHGSNLYMEQLHVPLVLSFPGRVPANVRVAEPVSLRDVPATVAQLLGLPQAVSFPGESLARTWGAAPATLQPVFAELTPGLRPDTRMNAVVAERHHYIRNPSGSEELYDWQADPAEKHDLITTQPGRSIGSQLAGLLERTLACASGAASGQGAACDP